jgi:hypothetical protein
MNTQQCSDLATGRWCSMAAQDGGGLEVQITARISYIVIIPANIVPWYRSSVEGILQDDVAGTKPRLPTVLWDNVRAHLFS